MTEHWSANKVHPYDPSLTNALGPFPRCVVCGWGPSHPIHQVPVEVKEAA